MKRQFVKWGAIPNLQPSKILWKHETSCVTLITSLWIILLGWQGRSWGDRAHYYYRHNILHPCCLFFLIITVHHFVQWTTLRSLSSSILSSDLSLNTLWPSCLFHLIRTFPTTPTQAILSMYFRKVYFSQYIIDRPKKRLNLKCY